MINEESGDIKVELPTKEATKLLSELRKKLPTVPMSVSASVERNGVRALHVSCDHPEDDQVWFNKIYKADMPLARIIPHAVKHIKAKFELS